MSARVLPLRVFVGRNEELARLRGLLSDTRGRHGGMALIGGEPGIGKTALVEQAAADAAEMGLAVRWGRCAEQGAAPAFWPWVQVVRQMGAVGGDGPVSRLAALDGIDHELALSTSERFRLFDAVTRALGEHGPHLIVLEDLHQGDESSLRLLSHVVAESGRSPVAVVGTYRRAEIDRDHPLRALLANIGPGSVHIELDGLSSAEVGALAQAVGARTDVDPAGLHRRTGGNPLFVTELVRLATRELPETVVEAIRRRLERLAEPVRRLLLVAAVIGREFDTPSVAAVADRSLGEVDDELHAVARDGLLKGRAERNEQEREPSASSVHRLLPLAQPPQGSWSFVHALVGEVLVAGAAPSLVAELHERLARFLIARGGAASGGDLPLIAFHLIEAANSRPVPDAWSWARAAANDAVRRLAFEEACRVFADAERLAQLSGVDPAELAELALEAGQALQRRGSVEAARERFEATAELARRLDRPDLLARAAVAVGLVITGAGRVDRALVQLLRDALTAVDDDDPIRAELLARLGLELYWDTSGGINGRATSREAVAAAERTGSDRAIGRAKFALLFTLRGPDADLAERLALGADLVRAGIETGATEVEFQARIRHSSDLLESGNVFEYRRQVALVGALASRSHQPLWMWWSTMLEGCLAILEGRFDDGRALADDLLRFGRGLGAAPTEVYVLSQRVMMARDTGSQSELAGELDRLIPRFEAFTVLPALQALVLVESADPVQAAAVARPLWDDLDAIPRDALWLSTMTLLAESAVLCGETRAVTDVLDRLRPFGDRFAVTGTPVTFGAVDRPLGVMAAAIAEYDEGEARLCRARNTFAASGAIPLLARTNADLARLYVARGAPGDAQAAAEAVSEARRLAGPLGLRGIIAPAATASSRRGDGPELTRRELELLACVASGSTNRQIASDLHISVHTVERHLANIYTKLGVANRTEAASHAARLGMH